MNLLKAGGTIGGLTLVSRILGFAREMVFARVMGASAAAEGFIWGFQLPKQRRRRLCEGAVSPGFGPLFARRIGKDHAKYLERHLAHGGLLLWVRTSDAEREKTALEILRRHSAEDVHLHQLPRRAGKESDVPRERPRILHLLDWTIPVKLPDWSASRGRH